MEVTIIGCWGAYPKPNEATSGYLVDNGGTTILLDCGSGVLSRLQNHCSLEELDAVVVTHTHADHIADLYSLEFAILILTQIGKRTRPLDVYVYCEHLDKLAFCFPEYVHVHPIVIGQPVSIGTTKLEFSENVHDVPCCAVRLTTKEGRTLVYSGDTGFCQSIIDIAQAADVLLLESSFYNWQKGKMNGHLTSGEAGEIAALAAAKQLVLTHFPHYGELEQMVQEASKQYDGSIRLACCDMKITI